MPNTIMRNKAFNTSNAETINATYYILDLRNIFKLPKT